MIEFRKIKRTEKSGVTLAFLEHINANKRSATETTELKSSDEPLPEFNTALQAFKPYVLWLIPWLKPIKDSLTVTGVSLSRAKDGRRGLIVTFTSKIAKASDRPLVMNSPLMLERSENATEDEEQAYFRDDVLDDIAAIEVAANNFRNGAKSQIDAFEGKTGAEAGARGPKTASGKTDGEDDVTKHRRRRQKQADANEGKPEVAQVVNPLATEEPTTETIRVRLLAAGRDVPLDAVDRWVSTERVSALAWADQTIRAKAGEIDPINIPEIPNCVKADGSPSLLDAMNAAENIVANELLATVDDDDEDHPYAPPPKAENVVPIAASARGD